MHVRITFVTARNLAPVEPNFKKQHDGFIRSYADKLLKYKERFKKRKKCFL